MLDDLNRIKKFDTGRVAESIELLPLQMKQVMDEAKKIKITAFKNINNVVVNGMGGSNLGVHIMKSIFADELRVPVEITPGYDVPAYVDKNTLYVFSSYSGTTEEVLSVYDEVKKRGAKTMAIVASGTSKLEKLIQKDKIPAYIFKPEQNPSNQPRLGLGYSIFGLSMLFAKAGLLSFNSEVYEKMINNLEIIGKNYLTTVESKNNEAKTIAAKLHKKIPVLVAAQFLSGNLHAMRNQINENSKNFAAYLVLPDLNHYAMEGLTNPTENAKNLSFLFFGSDFYHPRIQKRYDLTKEVVKKNKIEVVEYIMKGETKLEQAFELLLIGAWISFYLGILNQVNPVEIKWVDWFKKKLDE